MPSELVYRLIKLATKPGYTPMPASMLAPPVVKQKDNTTTTPSTSRLVATGLADPLPPNVMDRVNKVHQANPGLKGGFPEITGGSIGFRF